MRRGAAFVSKICFSHHVSVISGKMIGTLLDIEHFQI